MITINYIWNIYIRWLQLITFEIFTTIYYHQSFNWNLIIIHIIIHNIRIFPFIYFIFDSNYNWKLKFNPYLEWKRGARYLFIGRMLYNSIGGPLHVKNLVFPRMVVEDERLQHVLTNSSVTLFHYFVFDLNRDWKLKLNSYLEWK